MEYDIRGRTGDRAEEARLGCSIGLPFTLIFKISTATEDFGDMGKFVVVNSWCRCTRSRRPTDGGATWNPLFYYHPPTVYLYELLQVFTVASFWLFFFSFVSVRGVECLRRLELD